MASAGAWWAAAGAPDSWAAETVSLSGPGRPICGKEETGTGLPLGGAPPCAPLPLPLEEKRSRRYRSTGHGGSAQRSLMRGEAAPGEARPVVHVCLLHCRLTSFLGPFTQAPRESGMQLHQFPRHGGANAGWSVGTSVTLREELCQGCPLPTGQPEGWAQAPASLQMRKASAPQKLGGGHGGAESSSGCSPSQGRRWAGPSLSHNAQDQPQMERSQESRWSLHSPSTTGSSAGCLLSSRGAPWSGKGLVPQLPQSPWTSCLSGSAKGPSSKEGRGWSCLRGGEGPSPTRVCPRRGGGTCFPRPKAPPRARCARSQTSTS